MGTTITVWNRGHDDNTGQDYVNGFVDDTGLHAVTAPRDGGHRGSVTARGQTHPVSLERSISTYSDDELRSLIDGLTTAR